LIGYGLASVLFVLSVQLKMVNESIRDAILASINAYYEGGKAPMPTANPVAGPPPVQFEEEMKKKHKNVRDMVLRTISKIDALDNQTSAQLKNLVSRMDDMQDDANLTKARLESHIETSDERHRASDTRHDVAEARHRINSRKIAEVRAEAIERQDLNDAKIFDVMQHVDDCKARVDVCGDRLSALERSGEDVVALATMFQDLLTALEHGRDSITSVATRFAQRLSSLERGNDDISVLATRFAERLSSLERGNDDISALATKFAERLSSLERGNADMASMETGIEERLRTLEAFVSARSPVQVRPEAYAMASQAVQQWRTTRGA
jgi:chromosome segregation ATPase